MIYVVSVVFRRGSNLPENNDTTRYFDGRFLGPNADRIALWSDATVTDLVTWLFQRMAWGIEPLQYLFWLCLLLMPLIVIANKSTNRQILFPLMVLGGPMGFDLVTNAFRQSLALSLVAIFLAIWHRASTSHLLMIATLASLLVHWSLLISIPLILANAMVKEASDHTVRLASRSLRIALGAFVLLSTAWILLRISTSAELHYDVVKYLQHATEETNTLKLMFVAQLPLTLHVALSALRSESKAIGKIAGGVPFLVSLLAIGLPAVGYRLLYNVYVLQSILMALGRRNWLERRYLGLPFIEINTLVQCVLMIAWVTHSSYAHSVFTSHLEMFLR